MKRLNEKGVNEFVGVMLMVAITVFLAAILAAMVFGFAGNQDKQWTEHKTIVIIDKESRGGFASNFWVKDQNYYWYQIRTFGNYENDEQLYSDFQCGSSYNVVLNKNNQIVMISNTCQPTPLPTCTPTPVQPCTKCGGY